MKIIKNMLYIAVVTIALTYFSCNSKLKENKAANGGTGTQTTQTPNPQTPAVQTEEEKLKDDIAKEANCPSTAPTYDFNTFAKLADDAARLHWLRCALKTQSMAATLKGVVNSDNDTLLHSAVEHGDLESVKLLVKIVKIEVNAKGDGGSTALMLAAQTDRLEIGKYLVSAGADVNVKDGKGSTALMWAAQTDRLEIGKYLVSAGADVNVKDNTGSTALMWAAANGHLDIVKYLVSAGADVNMMSNDEWIALMWAAVNGHLDIVKYLVSAGSDVNMMSNDGWIALMLAAVNDHLNVVEYLAKPTPDGAGADVTLTGSNPPKTACDYATGKSNEQAMKTAMHDCK